MATTIVGLVGLIRPTWPTGRPHAEAPRPRRRRHDDAGRGAGALRLRLHKVPTAWKRIRPLAVQCVGKSNYQSVHSVHFALRIVARFLAWGLDQASLWTLRPSSSRSGSSSSSRSARATCQAQSGQLSGRADWCGACLHEAGSLRARAHALRRSRPGIGSLHRG